MSLTFDAATTAAFGVLGPTGTKVQWCETLLSALGSSIKLVFKWASTNAGWAASTTFFDADLLTVPTISGGNLAGFGPVSNKRTQNAGVDLAAGFGLWRLTSADGTRWVQGTLGLTNSSADLRLSANLTATSGLGFASSMAVNAPLLLASGTGPVAPAWTADTPKTVVIMDYTNPSAPTEAGRASFDERVADMVYQHPGMAAENGDVAIWRSTQTIRHGDIDFGIHMQRSGPQTSESGTKPLERVMLLMNPWKWENYPASQKQDGTAAFDKATMTTFAPPFKARILNDAGTQIGVIEMNMDGKAVNAWDLAQDEYFGNTTGLKSNPLGSGKSWHDFAGGGTDIVRPHVNCAMVLQWANDRPRISSRLKKYFGGMTGPAVDPWNGKKQASMLAVNFLSYANGNSVNNYYAAQQWGNPKGVITRQAPVDPYIVDNNTGTAAWNAWAHGWGYEPGSISLHDWYTGPGGPRFDRAVMPTSIAMHLTFPNGNRLENNAPYADMGHAFLNAYCNHSRHYVRNARTGAGLPKAESLAGLWVSTAHYYGGRGPGPRSVTHYAPGNADNKYSTYQTPTEAAFQRFYDYTGRTPFNFYLWEAQLHGYGHPGTMALYYNSPMHAILQRFAYDGHFLNSLDFNTPIHDPLGYYGMRMMAWLWFAHLSTWIVGANHELVYSQLDVENRFQTELERIYDLIYVPAFVNNQNTMYFKAMRNLGVPCQEAGNDVTERGGNLYFYIAHVLQLMKVTGMFAKMKAKSAKCSAVLDMVVIGLSKDSVDWILAGNGKDPRDNAGERGYAYMTYGQKTAGAYTVADIPSSWADWAANTTFAVGNSNWVKNSAGNIMTDEGDAAMNLKVQWCHILKNHFSEYNYPNVDAAIAAFDNLYAQRRVPIDAQTTPANKRGAGMTYLFPCHGVMLPTEA